MRRTELKPSPDGCYRRNLGFIQNGAGVISQPKFNLGSVKRAAQERLEKIAAIWRRAELESAENEDRRPLWGPQTLEIAKAIAKGRPEFGVERTCDDPYQYTRHVEATAREYPEIRIVPADEEWYRLGKARAGVTQAENEGLENFLLDRARRDRELVLKTPGNESKYIDLLGDRTL